MIKIKTEYERLVDYAYSLLISVHDEYLKGNYVTYPMLLIGIGNCKVESRPQNGHNYQAVIDAIHEKYLKDHKVSSGFYNGIDYVIDKINNMTKDSPLIQMAYNWLYYQAKKERDSSATFSISHEELMHKLETNVKNNENLSKDSHLLEWLENGISQYTQLAEEIKTNTKKENEVNKSNSLASKITNIFRKKK